MTKRDEAFGAMRKALEAWVTHFGPIEDNHMLNDDCRAVFAKTRAALRLAEEGERG
jgi:hypothetical protein